MDMPTRSDYVLRCEPDDGATQYVHKMSRAPQDVVWTKELKYAKRFGSRASAHSWVGMAFESSHKPVRQLGDCKAVREFQCS
jgi:hypothetical protein